MKKTIALILSALLLVAFAIVCMSTEKPKQTRPPEVIKALLKK